MITDLPLYVYFVFGLALIVSIALLFLAARKNIKVLFVIVGLGTIQAIMAAKGLFVDVSILPPPILLLFPPTFLVIILCFTTKGGRRFIDTLNVKLLTILHVVRIPVELSLYWIFVGGYIPEIMTFSGSNFDILAGLTAPIIFYFGYVKEKLGAKLILTWNILSLGLLFTIIIIALLSAPLPFQQICFDQPNVGVLHFPFVWLPGIIVPIVMLAHLASIRRLLQELNYLS